jgi:hemolysin III
MPNMILDPSCVQSRGEEFANSLSHALALAALIVGTPFLIMSASQQGNAVHVFGASVFAATAMLLYLSSTVYHALQVGESKNILRVFDHSAIFLLIAGTYTPFTLGVLNGTWGWTLFGLVWGLAAVGVAMKLFEKKPHPIISTVLYLVMGWLVVIAGDLLLDRLPAAGLVWLVAGGLSYTLGVVFFATDSKLPYGHFVWHLFVIGGTACHYFAVLWYAA